MAILAEKNRARKSRILITTGIYPPKIGGPAQYAKNLEDVFRVRGHSVKVKTYTIEDHLPTGIRHFFFFCKIIPAVFSADCIISLDTFSVGFPTAVAASLFGKKVVIRTGGDFLWEGYVERTKKKVLLREFYKTERGSFSFKERVIFWLTRFTLERMSFVIFSTAWQRDIFLEPYKIPIEKTGLIENYYGPKESSQEAKSKIFIGSTRVLVWKNLDVLGNVFDTIKARHPEAELFTGNLPYQALMEKMKDSYAVILVSLGDISPNMILDAVRLAKPFICTKEVGIYDRIKDAGIFVDPLHEGEIGKAVEALLTDTGYRSAKEKVSAFSFVHTWEDITAEFLSIIDSL